MWQRTYERLREQALDAEMQADDAFIHSGQQLLARIDSHSRSHSHRRKGSFWQ